MATLPSSPTSPSSSHPDPVDTVQDVLKCKWAILILGAIQHGTCRPSAIERTISGLSHKMLHQRLDKLTRLRLVERIELAEKTQKVEYRMTSFGKAVGELVEEIEALRERFPATKIIDK
jgi:DNA-binding HxlR family transcriptional regulator